MCSNNSSRLQTTIPTWKLKTVHAAFLQKTAGTVSGSVLLATPKRRPCIHVFATASVLLCPLLMSCLIMLLNTLV